MNTVYDELTRGTHPGRCNCRSCRVAQESELDQEQDYFIQSLLRWLYNYRNRKKKVPGGASSSRNVNRSSRVYIKWAQRNLNKIMGSKLVIDGIKGRLTTGVLKDFQMKFKLPADGRLEEKTEGALIRAGAEPPPVSTQGGGVAKRGLPARFAQLIPMLNRHRGNIPLHFLLGWIKVESDGRNDVITKSLNERGYFQIHPEESQDLGFDHERITRDPDYSIQSGIKLVQNKMRYANRSAAKLGVPVGSDLYWHIVKLWHWLPLGVKVIENDMVRRGMKPRSWEDYRSFVLSNRERIMQLIKDAHRRGKTWDPIKGVNNVDKLFRAANQFKGLLKN